MVFRNVIVCRIVPGSEQKVADVLGHYDKVTRPQDVGVTGRILLSLKDLYIHVVERAEDPAVTGNNRGLPAFKEIAEAYDVLSDPTNRKKYDAFGHDFRNVPDDVDPETFRRARAGGEPLKIFGAASPARPVSAAATRSVYLNARFTVRPGRSALPTGRRPCFSTPYPVFRT